MDPQDQAQPTEAQPVEQDGAAASQAPRESESGFMNSLIRRVAGFVGLDDEASAERTPEQPSNQSEATAQAETVTLTKAELETREREWQSKKDREVAQAEQRFRRNHALEEAEAGNLAPIKTLAEAGDKWALGQLSERGDVWSRGEIAVKQDLAEREAEQSGKVFRESAEFAARALDQAYFEPLIALVDDPAKAQSIREGAVGDVGRANAVKTILAHAKAAWQAEAVTKALADPEFARGLFKNDGFLKELRSGGVAAKMLAAHYRGELEQPDLIAGVGRGAGDRRENDEMNDLIRKTWQFADLAAPEERSAMAGATNGRITHRDLLDDD